MNNDETFEFENRVYVNPDISRDEQTAFVDTLRDLQAQKNAQIATETHNLGTDVPSHLGGLSGSEEYWQSKYQTPQVDAMVADMKAVAQQSALNTALQNYSDMLKNRYNQAYRAYQKRAYNYNLSRGGGGGGGDDGEDNPDFEETGQTLTSKENELVLPEGDTTDKGVSSNMNAYADITGQGKTPTSTYIPGVLIDKNGNRTAMRVHVGQGIEVAGGMSYNKAGARNFLSNWVKNGGKVSNGTSAPAADNYSLNMLAWDLYD